ncbi:MAG: AgrD family cyclic lactone autoinducer peptide [Lachnospira sp.]
MEKLNRMALMAIKKITNGAVKRNAEEWPPVCIGILHQPKRPEQISNNKR